MHKKPCMSPVVSGRPSSMTRLHASAEHDMHLAAEYAVTNTTAPFTIAFTEGVAKLYAYFLGRNEDGVRCACLLEQRPWLMKMLLQDEGLLA